MEIEELQMAWKKLNNKTVQNNFINERKVIEILSNRKETHLQKLLRNEKKGFIVLIGINLLVVCCFLIYKEYHSLIWLWITAFFTGIFNLIMCIISQKKLNIILYEDNLQKQIRNMLNYRLFKNKYTIAAYLSIVPYMISFLYYSGNSLLSYILLGVILLIISILDYFSFHHIVNIVKDVIHINKELSELKLTKNTQND